MQACRYGHWEVVQTLLLYKANVSNVHYTSTQGILISVNTMYRGLEYSLREGCAYAHGRVFKLYICMDKLVTYPSSLMHVEPCPFSINQHGIPLSG
jgi:hypothetical protein